MVAEPFVPATSPPVCISVFPTNNPMVPVGATPWLCVLTVAVQLNSTPTWAVEGNVHPVIVVGALVMVTTDCGEVLSV